MKKPFLLVVPIALLLLVIGLVFIKKTAKTKQNTNQVQVNTNLKEGEQVNLSLSPSIAERTNTTMEIDQNKSYSAILKTSMGEITISLTASQTPITVNNFVSLSRKNFYAKTIFHRVINGFMIQGGDPKGNGTGGPGYQFADEPFEGEYTKGTVAMANAGPNTNGSQFFIMQADYPLPKDYVIFGKVVSGLDVVDKIATAPVEVGPSGEMSKPVSPVSILSVEIIEK